MVVDAKRPRLTPRISCQVLEDWLSHALRRAGMTGDEATATAHVLAEADLRGVHSHGAVRLPVYIALVRRGVWVAGAEPKFLADHGVLSLLDGCHGVGPYIATRAMDRAVARARAYGAAWVWVRNAGHFGAAAAYTLQAARQGFIGFAFTNSSPAMAAWGGKEMTLGTNPWSVAVPAPRGAWPVVLDLANTVVARGKIRAARDRGEEIPEGWALDAEGRPTTDPGAALEGTLLPIGGYKGYGIAFMVEALTGVLAGAGIAREVESPYDGKVHQRLGQAFAAIDVSRLQTPTAFRSRMAELARYMRGHKRVAGVTRILLPGEREAALAKKQARTGILLPEEVRKAIDTAARELGMAAPV
jgi:LDH2 family malate/lactate/ureidoglycolate dehydrogenase